MRNFRKLLTAAVFVCVAQTAAIAQTLPAPWSSADVGAPAPAGSASAASGTFTVDASRQSISGEPRDQFHFVSIVPLTGNGEIVARLASLGNTDPVGQSRRHVPEALTGRARHAMMATTPGSGAWFGRRPNVARSAPASRIRPVRLPRRCGWLKARQDGRPVRGLHRSINGTTWIRVGSPRDDPDGRDDLRRARGNQPQRDDGTRATFRQHYGHRPARAISRRR